MEPIKQAVERAKVSKTALGAQSSAFARAPRLPSSGIPPQQSQPDINNHSPNLRIKEVELDPVHLEAHRIISYNVADPRSRSFDILRTQVLQSMDQRGWRCLAVTSPTRNCGKSVTAINLAFSIARQQGRSVVLVDLDLQGPQVANYLGLRCQKGMIGVLEGRTTLREAMINAYVGDYSCTVLPTEAPSLHSSELVASQTMRTVLQDLKAQSASQIVVLDLPPTLSGDDVISISPLVDSALLVAAVGISTQHEIKEAMRLLQSTEIVRVVLNKSVEIGSDQYY